MRGKKERRHGVARPALRRHPSRAPRSPDVMASMSYAKLRYRKAQSGPELEDWVRKLEIGYQIVTDDGIDTTERLFLDGRNIISETPARLNPTTHTLEAAS